MDASLAALDASINQSEEVKDMAEGKKDPNKLVEDAEWQASVSEDIELGRWRALLSAVFCALLYLPALALESCWPSFLGQIFSFSPHQSVMFYSHWIAFGATVSLLAATLVFLNVGADLRRGQYPFVVGLAGSWLVILNPVYFLLADHRYLNSSHPQDVIVLLLTIVGVMLLICAASWNASVDKLLKKWWSTPKGKMASMDGSGVHVSVSVLDEDEDDGVTVPESPRSR